MTNIHHHALKPGSHIGHFQIEAVLGTGGFGITYRAHDPDLNCTVAIKEFLPSNWAIRQDNTVIPKATDYKSSYLYGLKRFQEEAQTLAQFSHTSIVAVKQIINTHGTAYIVMPFEKGHTLTDYLEKDSKPKEDALKSLLIPILQGLKVVHEHDFLHRDIKPSNIYLRNQGAPLLIDFGSSRQALGSHSHKMTVILSQGYAPFEQYSEQGKNQGPWTDIYAIGATLYRWVTGNRPENAQERMGAQAENKVDPQVAATVAAAGCYSPDFLKTIDWMMQSFIKDRPQTVDEVIARIEMPPPKIDQATQLAPPDDATVRQRKDANQAKSTQPKIGPSIDEQASSTQKAAHPKQRPTKPLASAIRWWLLFLGAWVVLFCSLGVFVFVFVLLLWVNYGPI